MQLKRSTLPVCRLCGGTCTPWLESTLHLRRTSHAALSAGSVRRRRYERCATCGTIQVTAADLPTPEEERERYEEHNNDSGDAHYRDYLVGVMEAGIVPHLAPPARILDFGSGPVPLLRDLLRENGYEAVAYDPFFAPEESLLAPPERYDGVVAVEVVEHLHEPGGELKRLTELLRPGGTLTVRTGLFTGTTPEEFDQWWYRRDISHVVFWTEATLAWLQEACPLSLVARAPGTVLVFRRSGISATLSRTKRCRTQVPKS